MRILRLAFFMAYGWGISMGIARAENSLPDFQKANASYRGGDLAGAGPIYESLIRQGKQDAGVYYNLGNVYFKQNRIGLAILNYEKALKLSPRDRDTRSNLNYVKGLLEYRIQDNRNWYLKALESFLGYFTFQEIGVVSLALGLAFWIGWLVLLLVQRDSVWGWKQKTLMVVTLTMLSLWLLKGIGARTIQEAVVIKPDASVRYGPSYKDQIAFKLGDGMKVLIKKQAEGWSRVVLVNGETGWMAQEDIGVI